MTAETKLGDAVMLAAGLRRAVSGMADKNSDFVEQTLRTLRECDEHWQSNAYAIREGRISIYADAITVIESLLAAVNAEISRLDRENFDLDRRANDDRIRIYGKSPR